MNFGSFLLYTFLGAFVWNCVLALLGYLAHGQMDLITQYSHELSIAILVIVGLAVGYFIIKNVIVYLKKKKA